MMTPLFTRVLVGWDGSRSAAEGLRLGCQLTAFPGGAMTAVSIVPDFGHLEAADERDRAGTDARQRLEADFHRILETICLDPEQRASLLFVADHRVAESLDEAAARESADLLIVGLHGREGVLHPKMGHIAHHVVTTSGCPVLVIPDTSSRPPLHSDQPSHLVSALHGLFHPKLHHAAAQGSELTRRNVRAVGAQTAAPTLTASIWFTPTRWLSNASGPGEISRLAGARPGDEQATAFFQ